MQLSTRVMYGTRAMLYLARNQGGKLLMVKEIAEQEHLPATYLEQLMVLLRKGNLVNATRGAKGGYMLSRPATAITLAEIIEVLEGDIALAPCPAGAGCCGSPSTCALAEVLGGASATLREYFTNVTLADLVEHQQRKEDETAPMYSI